MFTKIQHVAATGACAVGVGWLSALNAPVAPAQPPYIPPANGISCPSGGGAQYLPDPENSNAWYTCEDGQETQHIICPQIAKLVWGTPPRCGVQSNHHMP